MTDLFCGIDWGESRHDVAIIDQTGTVVSRTKIATDATGFTDLLSLLAEAGDDGDDPIPVAIETDRGLLVAGLRATGRAVYPLNPLAASRYRARHQVSGAKSDAADAVLLANILRTDAAAHRPLPADTELVQAIRVLARGQQDAVWGRQKLGNQIRSLLKDFYPAALDAFSSLPNGGLSRPEARTILAAAPTPAKAAKLTRAKLRTLLVKAGSIWALAALKSSPGAKRHFQARRERGDWNRQAQRHLFNKFLGQLHYCLNNSASYDETHAFPSPLQLAA